MFGHFGFSYIGAIYLAMLFIPNIMWAKHQPEGYSPVGENKLLLLLERTGQVAVTCVVLIFKDFNISVVNTWSIWLAASFAMMILYEICWIRYFRSPTLKTFYGSFLGIPGPLATLPVFGFFLLGIYGKVIWLIIAVVILGIGHIGIHFQHNKKLKTGQVKRSAEEILQDILSKDTHKVWQASCEIISHGQDHERIIPFIQYLPEIKNSTKGLSIGGMISPNQRFVDFAIKTIEFHESHLECPCFLYSEGGYELFNPSREAKKGHIAILDTIMHDNCQYIDYYLVECLSCKQRFKVYEREYHFAWWEWTRIEEL